MYYPNGKTVLGIGIALVLFIVSLGAKASPLADALVGTTHTTYFSACKTESAARIVWEAHKENGIMSAKMVFGGFKNKGECGTIHATATVVRVLEEEVLDFMGSKHKMYLTELETEQGDTFYAAAAAEKITGA